MIIPLSIYAITSALTHIFVKRYAEAGRDPGAVRCHRLPHRAEALTGSVGADPGQRTGAGLYFQITMGKR